MLEPDPAALLRTLNRYCTRSLEAAAGICVQRGHYEVTVEHLLTQLLVDPDADVHLVLLHFGVDQGQLDSALQRHLEAQKTGNTGRPVFSPLLLGWLRDSWLLASTEWRLSALRSGALFSTLLLSAHSYTSGAYVELLDEIPRDELRRRLLAITKGSVETEMGPTGGTMPGRGEAAGQAAAAAGGAHSRGPDTALGRFTNDFTAQARAGELDPVVGREAEIRQCIDILARRRKNNPIIVGEAGVGKTALVEGIALRVVAGDVPAPLQGVDILGLDLGLLQAGAGMKGEFENRLKSAIDEVKASPKPIILFIDEAHTIIGAGGPSGGSDAANLLKPALARGELRTLAATTWSEYKKYFEKDAALARRFQLVKLDEPDEEGAKAMMRGLAPHYERSHKVRLRDDAVVAAVELSNRYISGRQLPDKSVDLLDTCAARVAIGRDAKPPVLGDLDHRIQILEREVDALSRDVKDGVVAEPAELATQREILTEARAERDALAERWEAQRQAVQRVLDLRGRLARSRGEETTERGVRGAEEPNDDGEQPDPAVPPEPIDVEQVRAQLAEAQGALDALHADQELVPIDVTPDLVAQVVSDWTGIPAGKMVRDEAGVLLELEARLGERIKGQKYALQIISEQIRGAKLGLGNPRSPIGCFLAVGPSGVGKTETGLALADLLFGGERFIVTINMSEFQEKHTVSRLIGSPPGYVGFGEGGVLTEAVRQRPYSVVLLDEVEKADPEVMNLFYQVFDKGQLSDGEGRVIDFRNTVLLMTSNLGADLMTELCSQAQAPTRESVVNAIRPILSRHFKPALLARMSIVPFFPLSAGAMREIVDLKLGHLRQRVMESQALEMTIDDAVGEQIIRRCTEVETGARNIDHIVQRTLLPMISHGLLAQMAQMEGSATPVSMDLTVDEQGQYALGFEVEQD